MKKAMRKRVKKVSLKHLASGYSKSAGLMVRSEKGVQLRQVVLGTWSGVVELFGFETTPTQERNRQNKH